jgi:hypothetical protein
MIDEFDLVVLNEDMPEHALRQGDVGAVVHVYGAEQAYEVEFLAADGTTIAVLTLPRSAVRPVEGQEILHVRDLTGMPT